MPIPNFFYGHQDALMRGASPTTLAVGDSWFWYPFDNLLGEIAGSRLLQSIVVAGYSGSEALDGRAQTPTSSRPPSLFTQKAFGENYPALAAAETTSVARRTFRS
ncbi:hypothetical protein FHT32_006984 [Variovorax sp. SG517]|uniref:hypothetical protein n=1 Tax=Variovorax sp. SG517 TaxID=2587117 RepID=UPI00159EA588|nr:hypothetical protein [Variovorax sp. SG517]NVM93287.1 hypothetical protein [Variovorax sp. SG517]